MRVARSLNYLIVGISLSIFIIFYSDVFKLLIKTFNSNMSFADLINNYFSDEIGFYLTLLFLLMTFLIIKIVNVVVFKDKLKYNAHKYYWIFIILIPVLTAWPLEILNLYSLASMQTEDFEELPLYLTTYLNFSYVLSTIFILCLAYFKRGQDKLTIKQLKAIIQCAALFLVMTILLQVGLVILPFIIMGVRDGLGNYQIRTLVMNNLSNNATKFLSFLALAIVITLLKRSLNKLQFDETDSSHTSGNFGSAAWATSHDLEKINAYSFNNGCFTATDMIGNALYFPLYNKLTISPPGGGKTSSSSIPILLSYDGPTFVFDNKGELWAVTAPHRLKNFKRKIIFVDPFGVTKGEDFRKGKPIELLEEYHFNPFDWIPTDRMERDRMINTFAASFVINEGGSVNHWDDNAKIIIRGYIDYIMSLDPKERNLKTLFNLMSEKNEEAEITFNQMSQQDGRSSAAANQVNRVGENERGSMLSTSYRQIDWMGDSNLQNALSHSNFNLEDFIKGDMDIFVILPEDQVTEHNRLVRMILSLLMSMIVKTSPSKLPKKKMLFLIEELAQLGYTPDVEKCIEVLRARGVIVWTVFQTLSQIEMFKKPDLFKGAPFKQIFTNDDTKTMEWIQALGGKKTTLTKTLSTNKGDSKKQFQTWGRTVSTGDGESIHETGVDLIPTNEIRELPNDEQIIFLHGTKPIRCKKVRYFEHPEFSGKFDPNPLETRN